MHFTHLMKNTFCGIMIRHTVAGICEILRIKRGNYALQELARAIVCKGVVIPFCILT
jgi:hypothetical protein